MYNMLTIAKLQSTVGFDQRTASVEKEILNLAKVVILCFTAN